MIHHIITKCPGDGEIEINIIPPIGYFYTYSDGILYVTVAKCHLDKVVSHAKTYELLLSSKLIGRKAT